MALFDNPSELNRMALEVQLEINKLKKEKQGEVDAIDWIDWNGQRVWLGVDLSQCDSKSNK